MPSPSPTSRRYSSSAASRSDPGSSRADLLSTRGLQQNFYTTSSNSAGSGGLNENIDDHKENSTENDCTRGAPARSNQSQKSQSKKPWVTHFAKPSTTLSVSNRILMDRNSSCSPVRSGATASGNGETPSDKKAARPTMPREQEDAAMTHGPAKGVAELSKRIQQFLEDQDVLLGFKTGSSTEIASSCASVTPVEPGQRSLSSPYNPYKSPFFDRPKFLRLTGNVSSMEGADVISAPVDGPDMVIEPPTEELPLFEGDQVLVTPLQQIHFSTSLSPSSNEDEEARPEEEAKEHMLGEVTIQELANAVEEKVLLISGGAADCLQELKAEVSNERMGKPPEKDNGKIGTAHALNQFQDEENQQGEVNVEGVVVKNNTVNGTPQEGFLVCQDQDPNLFSESAKTDEEVAGVDGDNVSWGKKSVRVLLCGALLAIFLALIWLSSASSGLLPPSLINNPVNAFWQSSKYHEHAMILVQGLDGLWSTEMVYFPADARVSVMVGAEFFQDISELFHHARKELWLFVQIASSTVKEWGRVLFQQISLNIRPDTAREHQDTARQLEWFENYEFEGEWIDELPKLAYTDWELLHEYDLEAANQFVLGSIPESLKNDIQRNFSRLSDSPEVRDLLEDLMQLKGGSTEEDRLEVLQYFWEYRRFSASAHQSLMKGQMTACKDGSKIQGFPVSYDHNDMESHTENVETDHDHGLEMIKSMDSYDYIDENHYQTPTAKTEDEQLPDGLAEHILEKMGIVLEQIVPEISDTASVHLEKLGIELEPVVPDISEISSEKLREAVSSESSHTLPEISDTASAHLFEKLGIELELIVPDMSETSSEKLRDAIISDCSYTLVSAAHENDALETYLEQELQRAVGNEDTSSTDVDATQPTFGVSLDINQLSTLAAFMVSSFFILGRKRQPRNATKLVSHASSVEFLKKSDQLSISGDDEAKQNRQPFADGNKQVTMIEELNDRFASVLQSPEPNNLHLRAPHAREDEDLIRSPNIPAAPGTSPYGSFTTYQLMSRKEGQAAETKLTPLRRSSRIRNHATMSPTAHGVKRIAISPP